MESNAAAETVRAYYDALRRGDPLVPFFADDENLVKVGISERLVGYETVAEGLTAQTESTSDWTVSSHDLRVIERDRCAWFSDAVRMEWTDIESRTNHGFDSRWSGTLDERDGWVFVGMHVSAPHEL